MTPDPSSTPDAISSDWLSEILDGLVTSTHNRFVGGDSIDRTLADIEIAKQAITQHIEQAVVEEALWWHDNRAKPHRLLDERLAALTSKAGDTSDER